MSRRPTFSPTSSPHRSPVAAVVRTSARTRSGTVPASAWTCSTTRRCPRARMAASRGHRHTDRPACENDGCLLSANRTRAYSSPRTMSYATALSPCCRPRSDPPLLCGQLTKANPGHWIREWRRPLAQGTRAEASRAAVGRLRVRDGGVFSSFSLRARACTSCKTPATCLRQPTRPLQSAPHHNMEWVVGATTPQTRTGGSKGLGRRPTRFVQPVRPRGIKPRR